MRRKVALEMDQVYPFGGIQRDHLDTDIYVVKRVPFSTAAQKCNILKKVELLRNLSCYSNIVTLLDVQTYPRHLNLIFEYLPYGFGELVRRNCDRELAEARRSLSEVTQQLQQLGVDSRINSSNVGLNEFRQLKCYVALEELPDFSLLQGQEECNSIRQQLHQSDQHSGEENNLSMEKQQSSSNIKSHALAVRARLEELQKEVVKRSGVSNYYSEKLQPVSGHNLVDDLLQKINGRLMELTSRRRQTSPSRWTYNSRKLSATEPQHDHHLKCWNNESTIASQHERKSSAKIQMIREQLQEVGRTSSMDHRASEQRSKVYPSIEQYENLRTQRKMMLERIKAVMERADSVMSGFRTGRKGSEHFD